MATDYLDAALADFSGYIAADELYDGPFCVLSIVDNRKFRRLTYRVLDHNPTHADIIRVTGQIKTGHRCSPLPTFVQEIWILSQKFCALDNPLDVVPPLPDCLPSRIWAGRDHPCRR